MPSLPSPTGSSPADSWSGATRTWSSAGAGTRVLPALSSHQQDMFTVDVHALTDGDVMCCSSRDQGEAQLKQLLEAGLTTFICLQAGHHPLPLYWDLCAQGCAFHVTNVPQVQQHRAGNHVPCRTSCRLSRRCDWAA